MKYHIIIYVTMLFAFGCSSGESGREIHIQNVRDTELKFAAMAEAEGLQKAFTAFAHPDAVLNRGELIKGVDAINAYYSDPGFESVTLKWQPSFIDVSSSGDLAYTYGPYELIRTDSTGQEFRNTGYFHTVWKRMPDGSWLYVYD
jgi:ketosteroid isomerase-like protein